MNRRIMVALLQLPGIGRKKAIRMFRDLKLVLEAASDKSIESLELAGITPESWIKALNKSQHIIEKAGKNGIEITTIDSEAYPESLYRLNDYPAVLFTKGDRNLLKSRKNMAVIGTRNPMPQSVDAARIFTRQLVEAGYCTVSGLAIGIDTACHEETVECGGKTIAVLPSGILNIYPESNKALADRIIESGGLLLSEYEPEVPPVAYRFIERDRIQSGLSQGVVVMQTTASGGTMHASRTGFDIGIPLYVYSDFIEDRQFSGNKELLSNCEGIEITASTHLNENVL